MCCMHILACFCKNLLVATLTYIHDVLFLKVDSNVINTFILLKIMYLICNSSKAVGTVEWLVL